MAMLEAGIEEAERSLAAPSGTSGDLSSLLHPMKLDTFFDEYWNRKALYLPGDAGKFAGLFDEAAFFAGLEECADLKVGYTDDRGWPAHFNIKPGQVPEMLASGKTVCASAIDNKNSRLTAFVNRVGEQFALLGRFFFNSYLSPDGAGFGLHLDHHPVMILQIEGSKRWWYSPEPGLRKVMTNVSFPRDRDVLQLPWTTVHRPAQESLCEVVLTPGDVLYLPMGTWHQAEAVGGSLGLTLAMESVTPLDLLQLALGPSLGRVELKSRLPGYWAPSIESGLPEELRADFAAALAILRDTIGSFTPESLFDLWLQAQSARRAQARKGTA
jgi:Cupin superfamily protein